MRYDLGRISNLSQDVERYDIFLQFGTGVMEDPYWGGDILMTLDCSEIDAWIISESMNIQTYGVISKRSSWESPTIAYRKIDSR